MRNRTGYTIGQYQYHSNALNRSTARQLTKGRDNLSHPNRSPTPGSQQMDQHHLKPDALLPDLW